MRNKWGMCVVPLAIVSELMVEWRERFRERSHVGGDLQPGYGDRVGAWDYLARESGLHVDRVTKIGNNSLMTSGGGGRKKIRQEFLEFDTVDKLACAMDIVHEWHHGRLKEFYGPIEYSPADLIRMDDEEMAAWKEEKRLKQEAVRERQKVHNDNYRKRQWTGWKP